MSGRRVIEEVARETPVFRECDVPAALAADRGARVRTVDTGDVQRPLLQQGAVLRELPHARG